MIGLLLCLFMCFLLLCLFLCLFMCFMFKVSLVFMSVSSALVRMFLCYFCVSFYWGFPILVCLMF